MTKSQIQTLLFDVVYLDWQFYVGDKNGVPYLQVRFFAPDSDSTEVELQSARKWMLSEYMLPQEIVQTAWKAVLTAVEHEAREAFLYRGRPIYGPHISLTSLYEAANHQERRN